MNISSEKGKSKMREIKRVPHLFHSRHIIHLIVQEFGVKIVSLWNAINNIQNIIIFQKPGENSTLSLVTGLGKLNLFLEKDNFPGVGAQFLNFLFIFSRVVKIF